MSVHSAVRSSRHLVITVHGIRDFGEWQERLKRLVLQRKPEIEFANYRYGYFSLVAFLVPFLRWIEVRRFKKEITELVPKDTEVRVDIVAHSFGTHIVGWGLRGIARSERPRVNTIVFAGSVLKPNFYWSDLMADGSVSRVVNECGTRDWVLVLSQLFVLLTGAAGLFGFKGMETDRFRNNWYRLGHGGFFSDDFMLKRWGSIFTGYELPSRCDERSKGVLARILLVLLGIAEPFKLLGYFGLVAFLAWEYLSLYETGEEQFKMSLSRQLAAQARAQLAEKPDLALLLSVEATRRYLTDEAEDSLLAALLYYPHLVSLLHAHINSVWMVAFSPDGKILASASGDHTIRLWDMATRQSLGPLLSGDTRSVSSVAFSPDGKIVASVREDSSIRLWDVATRQPLGHPLSSPDAGASKVVFSPKGGLLASLMTNGTIQLWDVANRQPLGQPLGEKYYPILNVAFSPDGKTLASDGGYSVAFSPDGKTLASSDCEFTRLWDVSTRRPLRQPLRRHIATPDLVRQHNVWLCDAVTREALGQPLSHSASVYSIAFSPDRKTLASGSEDHTIRLWDLATRQPLGQPLTGHKGEVYSVAFSPDGKTLASSARSDKIIRLWDVDNSQLLGQPLKGHSDAVFSMAFSRDGKTLASTSWDKTIRLWNVATGQPLGQPLTGHTGTVSSVAFSPDGKTLASTGGGGNDRSIRLWNVVTGQPLGQPLAHGSTQEGDPVTVSVVDFSPDGKLLASAGLDCIVRLWDVATGQPWGQPPDQSGSVCNAAISKVVFSPDGKVLASMNLFGTIRLWDVATGQRLGQPLTGDNSKEEIKREETEEIFNPDGKVIQLEGRFRGVKHGGVTKVVFSLDGKVVAAAYKDSTIQLWDVATRQALGKPLRGNEGRSVTSLVFHPDRKVLALLDDTPPADVVTGRALSQLLTPHIKSAFSLVLSPDGKVLATGGEDRIVWLWHVDIESWQVLACRIANRNLSKEEWKQYVGNDERPRDTCPATGAK